MDDMSLILNKKTQAIYDYISKKSKITFKDISLQCEQLCYYVDYKTIEKFALFLCRDTYLKFETLTDNLWGRLP